MVEKKEKLQRILSFVSLVAFIAMLSCILIYRTGSIVADISVIFDHYGKLLVGGFSAELILVIAGLIILVSGEIAWCVICSKKKLGYSGPIMYFALMLMIILGISFFDKISDFANTVTITSGGKVFCVSFVLLIVSLVVNGLLSFLDSFVIKKELTEKAKKTRKIIVIACYGFAIIAAFMYFSLRLVNIFEDLVDVIIYIAKFMFVGSFDLTKVLAILGFSVIIILFVLWTRHDIKNKKIPDGPISLLLACLFLVGAVAYGHMLIGYWNSKATDANGIFMIIVYALLLISLLVNVISKIIASFKQNGCAEKHENEINQEFEVAEEVVEGEEEPEKTEEVVEGEEKLEEPEEVVEDEEEPEKTEEVVEDEEEPEKTEEVVEGEEEPEETEEDVEGEEEPEEVVEGEEEPVETEEVVEDEEELENDDEEAENENEEDLEEDIEEKYEESNENIEDLSAIQELVEDEKVEELKFSYKKTLPIRLKMSSSMTKEYYSALVNRFAKYKNVKVRSDNGGTKISFGGKMIAYFAVFPKFVKAYFALNPSKYAVSTYHHKDVSDKKKFVNAPFLLKVTSQRSFKYAEKLSNDVIKSLKLVLNDSYQEVDYAIEGKTNSKELIELQGLGFLLKEEATLEEAKVLPKRGANGALLLENKVSSKKKRIKALINIETLENNFEANELIDMKSLKDKKIIARNINWMKVVPSDKCSKPLNVVANEFDLDAQKLIIITGGNVTKIIKL